jgi:S-formylglutathione hydrolase
MYLSGLTCTDENVCQKSGILSHLSKYGIALIAPDTSPRGIDLPGDTDSWDFGKGAGFYLDATEAPWSEHYHMASYVTTELLNIISLNFNLININKLSLFGHSMGGHGALTLGLKYPNLYQSISAFAPICHPMISPWGQKAFLNYLGNNEETWKEYDTCELLRYHGVSKYENILIDIGEADGFLEQQLRPNDLLNIAKDIGQKITYRQHEGYDHSYYFISTFMEDHVNFHAKYLL